MIVHKAAQRDFEARPVRALDINDMHAGAETPTEPAYPYQPPTRRQLLYQARINASLSTLVCHDLIVDDLEPQRC